LSKIRIKGFNSKVFISYDSFAHIPKSNLLDNQDLVLKFSLQLNYWVYFTFGDIAHKAFGKNIDAIEREPYKVSDAWIFPKSRVPVSTFLNVCVMV